MKFILVASFLFPVENTIRDGYVVSIKGGFASVVDKLAIISVYPNPSLVKVLDDVICSLLQTRNTDFDISRLLNRNICHLIWNVSSV